MECNQNCVVYSKLDLNVIRYCTNFEFVLTICNLDITRVSEYIYVVVLGVVQYTG
jgi:hypothetical protein